VGRPVVNERYGPASYLYGHSCIILMCVKTGCYTPTPRNVAPVRMPRLWFAIKLIARQLMIKPENLQS
jgi:hypothetical protein